MSRELSANGGMIMIEAIVAGAGGRMGGRIIHMIYQSQDLAPVRTRSQRPHGGRFTIPSQVFLPKAISVLVFVRTPT